MNVYGNFICHHQKLETARIIHRTNKQARIYVNKYIHVLEHYLAVKKTELLKPATTWMNLRCTNHARSEKPASEAHVLWFRLYDMWKRQNCRAREQISGCHRLGVGRGADCQGGFRG